MVAFPVIPDFINQDRRIAAMSPLRNFCKRVIRPVTTSIQNPVLKRPTVYFVLASNGFVKIGQSRNINRRINDLKVINPTIVLLGTVDKFSEREVHTIFSEYRSTGEWFHYTDIMVDFIRIHNDTKEN